MADEATVSTLSDGIRPTSVASTCWSTTPASAEHHNAPVVNMASLAGKSPQPPLSVYAATKAAVIAYARAMNTELNPDGVKSVAFSPGFVDPDISEFVKEFIPADEMLRPSDITEALRFMLRVSANCSCAEVHYRRD